MHFLDVHISRSVRAVRALRWRLFLVTAVFFSWNLTQREPSLLESQDFGIASDLFKSFNLSPDHSPLHFVLMNLWQRVDGRSLFFLRLPSALFCAAAVVIVASLAERMGGKAAGYVAAFFLAINPQVIDNAHSMRMYALVVLCAAATLWYLHAYLAIGRRPVHLTGLAVSVIVAVYNHLFSWLLVGSVVVILVHGLRRRPPTPRERGRLVRTGIVTAILLAPQLIHAFVAVGFTQERHALYRGVSSSAVSFFDSVGRTLFFGEAEATVALPTAALVLPLALIALGASSLGRRGVGAALALFGPALGASWILSHSSQIEARYLNYLAPAIAVLLGLGATRAARPVALAWRAPLVLGLTAISLVAGAHARSAPETDWRDAARRLEREVGPDDVVAVFPDYWAATFRSFTSIKELAPVAVPADLERVLARGKRVFLVRNDGRYFGNIEALLRQKTQTTELFRTQVRDPLTVYSVIPAAPPPPVDGTSCDLFLAGIVGSGGYAWQRHPNGNPFRSITALFGPSSLALVGYTPYRVPWYARALVHDRTLREPRADVPAFLAEAGVDVAAITCARDEECAVAPDTRAGLTWISPPAADSEVVHRDVHGTPLAIVRVRREPNLDAGELPPSVEKAVQAARAQVGPSGRVLALVPARPDYGRMATDAEQRIGRHLVDLGVDVVAGLGGYAAKEVEQYGHGLIAYSLGTLLRPPSLSLAARDSSGLGLAVRFVHESSPAYTVVPLTFDDRSNVVIGGGAPRIVSAPEMTLTALLPRARSGLDSEGQELGPWRPELRSVVSGSMRWMYEQTRALTEWFPRQPASTPLRPLDGGFFAHGAYVARRGVTSLGEMRPAVELESAGHDKIWVRFDDVPMGELLDLRFCLPDDRVLSKNRPFFDQRIVVKLADAEVFAQVLPYEVGWRRAVIDTRAFSGRTSSVTLLVQTFGTHFPVAFDGRVLRER